MARKNKTEIYPPEEKEGILFSDLDPNIRKTIFAVILLTMALVLGMSFFDLAGNLGKLLEKITSRLIGSCRYFLPFGLIILAIMYFKRLKRKAYWSLWIGLILIALGVLGLFHFFYDFEEMKELVREGKGGGYVGFSIAYLIKKIAGDYAGSIIFVSFLVVGVLITFNSYLAFLFKKKESLAEEKITLARGGRLNSEDRYKEEPTLDDKKIKIFSKIKNILGKDKNKEDDEKFKKKKEDDKLRLKTQNEGNNRRSLFGLREKRKKRETNWELPPISLLKKGGGKPSGGNIKKNSFIIEKTFRNFGIEAEVIDSNVGPTVTQYAIRPAEGIRLSKIVALQNDLSMALAAHPIRIEAPIPGKSLVGIEVPNEKFALVRIRSLLETASFMERTGLTVGLGEMASGDYLYADLNEMPHLLISGATGAGKSIGISGIINSLIFKNSPQDLKLILIDPKRVELTVYNEIPHLLTEVIVDIEKVVNSLKWTIAEMERRYVILQEQKCRDIKTYNQKIEEEEANEKEGTSIIVREEVEIEAETNFVEKIAETESLEKLPFIVVIIDELADIMSINGKEVETLIVRIAQKARAVGIHLILSTQRPSVEVITGLIKANIPTRIAYQVASQIDSRTILDMAGAEKLLGKGDMLYLAREESRPKRIQGVYIEDKEIERVVDFLKNQGKAEYDEEVTKSRTLRGFGGAGIFDSFSQREGMGDNYEDDLFEIAKEVVVENRKASATFLQRKLKVGYARAARLMEMLEKEEVIGPYNNGTKTREILMGKKEDVGYEDDIIDQEKRNKWNIS